MQLRKLGRSSLNVTELCLGTMQFGWTADEKSSFAVMDAFVEAGGNFIDTADIYTQGTAERWLGEFIAEAGVRDRVVLATKYTLNHQNAGRDPNAAGNGRKHLMHALHGSLRRLATDHVDLFYLHAWDALTSVEEVVRTMDDLVRAGKIRHWALSDVPAWYAARAFTLAEQNHLERPCAIQMEYSLVSRGIEYEFASLARHLGTGVVAWSPLGGGLLSGKYRPHASAAEQNPGRIQATAAVATPALSKLTAQNWDTVAVLERVASQIGRPMAQVAVQWAANRPGISAVILGATRVEQLDQTLSALDLVLPPELEHQLDQAGRLPPVFPYAFIDAMLPRMHGGAVVLPKPPRFAESLTNRSAGWSNP